MKIGFAELEQHLRVGGLEQASRGLENALRLSGHEVQAVDAPGAVDSSFDILHFHGLWSRQHLAIERRCNTLGVATVVSPHGMLEPWARRAKRWKKWPYFHLIERHRLNRAKAVLATAEQEAERLQALLPKQRIVVLGLGCDADVAPEPEAARQRLGWDKDETVLLYLSRIHKKKGLLELLQSLARIRSSIPASTRLVIIGDGDADYTAACRTAAEALEGALQIDWLPAIWGAEKWDYLKAADLMALPTYSENFGIIVLEAAKVGTRVLTTNETPWMPIAENGFGWVTPPTPQAYDAALTEFFKRSEWPIGKRREMATWAAQNFNWSQLAKRYAQLYSELSLTAVASN